MIRQPCLIMHCMSQSEDAARKGTIRDFCLRFHDGMEAMHIPSTIWACRSMSNYQPVIDSTKAY